MQIIGIQSNVNESNINQIIAINLRIARQVKGLTLKDMGEMLGITYQQFQNYETGKNSISIGKLLVIANHLDLPVNFFFEEFKLNRIGDN
jgi:transcriptional regulator with XRE-family HTH domain